MLVVITGGQGDMAVAIGSFLEIAGYTVHLPSRYELDVRDHINCAHYIYSKRPDILVNVAGYIKPATLKDATIGSIQEHFNVNTLGAIYAAKYAVECGCHTLISIGSTSAFEGREQWGAYCASKAAITSLTESWAREGYRAIDIHPARTNTKMRKSLYSNEDVSTLMDPQVIGHWVLQAIEDPMILSGSHIILKKNSVFILPMRVCP